MMTFSSAEILESMICALIYGASFAALLSLAMLIKGLVVKSGEIFKEIIGFEKIFPLPRFKEIVFAQGCGAVLSFFAVVSFAVGFSMLSYYSLDGELRLYMLILSFASFYLSKFVFSEVFVKIFLLFFRTFLTCFALLARVFILPIRSLVRRMRKTVHIKHA